MTLETDFRTVWVIGVVALALIGYDVYAFIQKKRGDTISEVMGTWALKYPIVPFLAGVLAGHFFWPQVLK